YAIAHLRRLADGRRGGSHPDLYRGLRLLFFQLRAGYAPLGLPALGGFLFSARATPHLDQADIANFDLLNAIRALAFATEGKVRRPIDYKNMGAEELGSVYESLLELYPRLHVGAAEFTLDVAAGNERKTTGSYYTPTGLINSLLDSALEPVIADRLQNSPDRERAILEIKVVDPAAGSGHFLIAAARRLARHLVQVRTGDEEPSPEAVRHALRDVVGRCIYGVDINEMAVELCKVALWMETLDPGKPLSFLDANIQCGNSLMGATPALLVGGIPNNAFKPITGDDKAYCREWKKQNKAQKKQGTLFSGDMQPWDRLGDFATAMRQLISGGDETLADVQAREAEYVRLMQGGDYEFGKLWTDAWCAAFVWVKKPEGHGGWAYPITEQVFRNLERSPYREPNWLKDEVRRLADEHQFFHWHLAFPQVFTPREDLIQKQIM
ncbi:MAG: N-6 DNA methylase, partial [Chloroflexi bacterium]|nr:N-6 DNA methylase [Chloroflexota bacterium]